MVFAFSKCNKLLILPEDKIFYILFKSSSRWQWWFSYVFHLVLSLFQSLKRLSLQVQSLWLSRMKRESNFGSRAPIDVVLKVACHGMQKTFPTVHTKPLADRSHFKFSSKPRKCIRVQALSTDTFLPIDIHPVLMPVLHCDTKTGLATNSFLSWSEKLCRTCKSKTCGSTNKFDTPSDMWKKLEESTKKVNRTSRFFVCTNELRKFGLSWMRFRCGHAYELQCVVSLAEKVSTSSAVACSFCLGMEFIWANLQRKPQTSEHAHSSYLHTAGNTRHLEDFSTFVLKPRPMQRNNSALDRTFSPLPNHGGEVQSVAEHELKAPNSSPIRHIYATRPVLCICWCHAPKCHFHKKETAKKFGWFGVHGTKTSQIRRDHVEGGKALTVTDLAG